MFKIKRFLLLTSLFVSALPVFSESNSALYRYWGKSDVSEKAGAGKLQSRNSAKDFAIGPNGKMYIVAQGGAVYVYDEGWESWQNVDKHKRRLIGTLKSGLKGRINKQFVTLDPQKLDRIGGYARRVAVSPDNQIWVVTRDETIYKREGDHWLRVPGLASDIDIGKDGSIWALGPDQRVGTQRRAEKMAPVRMKTKQISGLSRWNGRDWQTIAIENQAGFEFIYGFTVAGDGTPWVIQPFRSAKTGRLDERILRWDGEQWQQIPLGGNQHIQSLTSDEDGTIWACAQTTEQTEFAKRGGGGLH